MFEGRRVAVVVPAHNEEKLIDRVIDTMPPFVDRVIVVDDCSKDRTAELVAARVAQDGQRVRLVRRERNGGVGAAIVSGYHAALEEGRENGVVVVMAGDAQMDPADLPRLLAPIVRNEAD